MHVDATVVVLNSGNYEYIGIRHRASQTLFLSDPIQPPSSHDPAYGKIEIGLYIWAFQDAMERWELNSRRNTEDKGSDTADPIQCGPHTSPSARGPVSRSSSDTASADYAVPMEPNDQAVQVRSPVPATDYG